MPSPYEDREQTEVKHRILERYLEAFIPIVGDWANDITYIDCLAGPWESVDPVLADTSFARAIKVIRSTRQVLSERGKHPSLRCLLIENNPSRFQQLEQYSKDVTDVEVCARNWDFMDHVQDVVRFAREGGKGSFPFVFIDPTGWKPLQIDVISPILHLNPGEVLINLMTSWMKRFLSDESKQWNRLVGSDLASLLSLEGDAREDQLVSSYASNVRRTGAFQYVCSMPVMKADQDTFHYHVIYGTRHPKGVEVFKKTEEYVIPFMHEVRAQAQQRRKFAQDGQYSFLGPQAFYRETRFSRFRTKNLELARAEVRTLLESRRTVGYDDAWLTAMQYSTVTESDIRDWLNDWRSQGMLEIKNLPPKSRVPRRGYGVDLEWNLAKHA
ncbi:MAG: three-Cys-motif partner protein TcmP [Candidatus Acidiferrum sp.]